LTAGTSIDSVVAVAVTVVHGIAVAP
jgi:hypothetical protein